MQAWAVRWTSSSNHKRWKAVVATPTRTSSRPQTSCLVMTIPRSPKEEQIACWLLKRPLQRDSFSRRTKRRLSRCLCASSALSTSTAILLSVSFMSVCKRLLKKRLDCFSRTISCETSSSESLIEEVSSGTRMLKDRLHSCPVLSTALSCQVLACPQSRIILVKRHRSVIRTRSILCLISAWVAQVSMMSKLRTMKVVLVPKPLQIGGLQTACLPWPHWWDNRCS